MSKTDEGSSEADAQFVSAKISVWWDIENCHVGRAVDPCAIAQNINSSLKKMNYTGPFSIFAYGDIDLIPPLTQQALSTTAVQLNHVPPTPGVKDGSDKMILVDMMLWAADNPAPANVLLISGDRDFAYALQQLKNKGYNVLLAHPKQRSAFLAAVAPTAWLWTDLMAGGEPVPKRELQQVDTSGSDSNLLVSEVLPNQGSSLVPISANDLRQDSISLLKCTGSELMSGNTDSENSGAGRGSPESSRAVLNMASSVIAPVKDHVDADASKKNSDFGQGSLPHLDCNSNSNSNSNLLVSDALPSPGTDADPINPNTPENSNQGRSPPAKGRDKGSQRGKQTPRFSQNSNMSHTNCSPPLPVSDFTSKNTIPENSVQGCPKTPVSEALVTPSIVFDLTPPNTLSGNIAKGYSAFPFNVNAFASSSKNITSKLVRNESVDKYQDTETSLRGTTETPKMPIDDEQAALAVENILFALKILRKEKIMPTKENIADSILYANVDFPRKK